MEKRLKTDVLIVGGGMAGWHAADKARRQGAQVIIADKGYIGKVGQSVYAGGFFVYNPEWGDDKEAIMNKINVAGDYLNNRTWSEIVLDGSYEAFCSLVSWGFDFKKDENGNYLRVPKMPGDLPEIEMLDSAKEPHKFSETFGYKARKHLKEIGAEILDRVMIVKLLKEADRIAGAVGISVDSDAIYVIEAGAVILCSGGCGLKPVGYPCLSTSTGDGERMAAEVGCSLVGKEFVQPMRTSVENPAFLGCRGLPKGNGITEAGGWPIVAEKCWSSGDEPFNIHEGKHGAYVFSYLDWEFEFHAGNGPITAQTPDRKVHVVTGGALGLSVRKADGVWPGDFECRSEVKGLFAAGDALGTMQNGALYLLRGGSMAGCAVTGAIAGEAAAKEVLAMNGAAQSRTTDVSDAALGIVSTPDMKEKVAGLSAESCPRLKESTVQAAVDEVLAPLNRIHGYSPSWVTETLRNVMTPYFISYVKSAERLRGALSYVEFLKSHVVPSMVAQDRHELRLCHEAESMVQAARVRLRSALFREESRGMHFREDFPARDDENWLCWTKVSGAGADVSLEKVNIPDEWKPDMNIPYEERYTFRFPGELEYLSKKQGREA